MERYDLNADYVRSRTYCKGIAELTLEHPIDDLGRWEYLVNDNVIAAPTPYSKKQLLESMIIQRLRQK